MGLCGNRRMDKKGWVVIMKWYFLAFLVWIIEILMFASIILIPFVMYLRNETEWFARPFAKADSKKWNYPYHWYY